MDLDEARGAIRHRERASVHGRVGRPQVQLGHLVQAAVRAVRTLIRDRDEAFARRHIMKLAPSLRGDQAVNAAAGKIKVLRHVSQ